MTTRKPGRSRAAFRPWAAAAVLVAFTFPLSIPAADAPAQTTTSPAKANDETVQLTPFEVRADADNSYGALQSNSLTAFRMDLEKMPATAQVFTQTFMDDIAATSIEEVLTGYAGTVTASSSNASASIEMVGDRDGGSGLSIRGTGAGEMKRDGFTGPHVNARTASGKTDNFSIERIELVEGPQSILYGAVGGGGVINNVSKRAQFGRNRGSVRLTFNQYGGKRGQLDYNIGAKNVAVRVAAAVEEKRTFRYNIGGDFSGLYTEIAFKLGQNTILRLHTEKTSNFAITTKKPNIDNFLPVGDSRRGKDVRWLALTGQLENLGNTIINGGVNYRNLESLFGWWNGENIKDHWTGAVLESKLPWGFSTQLTAYYDNMVDNRLDTIGPSLVPGRGLTGSAANPYDGSAIRIPAPLADNQQRNRDKGVRVELLHEKTFQLFGVRGDSKTALGASGFHQYPGFGSGGVTHAYYQADANWNPVYAGGASGPDYTKTEYGRIIMPSSADLYVPIQNGIPLRPFFAPTSPRITVNGVNYVRLQRIYTDPSFQNPVNFKGAVPNAPGTSTGFSGSFNNNAETHSRYYSATNVTDWMNGRLTTLVGYGFTNFESENLSIPPPDTFVKFKYLTGWGIGANYRVLKWMRAYVELAKSAQASGSTDDIIGQPLKTPDAKSPRPEIGLKFFTPDNTYAAQLNWNPSTLTRFENKNIGDASFTDIINPDGINHRFGTGTRTQQRVNLDRTLESMSLVLTAQPTPNWRIRLLAAHIDGKIAKDVAYKQLYNDQFYVNGGVISYADKTPVLVDPTAKNPTGPKVPLTLAMITDPTNPYYVTPNVDSGSISNPTLKSVLTAVDPIHGTAATGVTGLPVSQNQYGFVSAYPDDTVLIYKAGERNTGFNEYTFNFTNHYDFREGFLKGVGVLVDLQTYYKNRAYYTIYPGSGSSTSAAKQVRMLYRLPAATQLNLGVSYRRKLMGKYAWSSQLNIRNALNHYRVWVVPTPGNGNTLNARLSANPREFVWSNSIEF
jgi:outer membrane receptor protein involved in Fe transport